MSTILIMMMMMMILMIQSTTVVIKIRLVAIQFRAEHTTSQCRERIADHGSQITESFERLSEVCKSGCIFESRSEFVTRKEF